MRISNYPLKPVNVIPCTKNLCPMKKGLGIPSGGNIDICPVSMKELLKSHIKGRVKIKELKIIKTYNDTFLIILLITIFLPQPHNKPKKGQF